MKITAYLFLAFLIVSCAEKKTKKNKTVFQKTIYSAEKLYNENAYTVYLPANYDTTKTFPSVYFFDPQGKGNFPVEKYKTISDELGIILIGSNAIKNGMSWDEISKFASNIFSESQRKFSIDKTKIIVCGFSGGARVAGNLALFDNSVTAVISCSAGLPAAVSQLRKNLIFIAIAGKEDMNLTEVFDAGELLKNSEIKHRIKYFEGTHEWCPSEIMNEAIQFCLSPTLSAVENKHKIDKKIIEQEKLQKQIYTQAFAKNDFGWWKTDFQNLEQKIKNVKGEEKDMYIRLKNFLSLAAYSYSNAALNNRSFQEADKFLNIYKLVDIKNSEHAYLRAKYFILLNKTAEAEQALIEATELGFNDIERLKNETILLPLQNTNTYQKIVNR